MNIEIGNVSHQGARENQQDDFGFSDFNDPNFSKHGGILAVLADGMGGLAHGGEASFLSIQRMREAYSQKESWETIPQALARALGQTNKAVVELGEQTGESGNVGTTLVAVVVHDDQLYWVSVGDSRLYLLRNEELNCLTVDHSYWLKLSRLVETGELSLEQAEALNNPNALTSYLGQKYLFLVDHSQVSMNLKEGDHLLICSDGLHGSLEKETIKSLLSSKSAQKAANNLLEAVLQTQNPYQDNITVVILAIGNANGTKKVFNYWVFLSFVIVIIIGFLGYQRHWFN